MTGNEREPWHPPCGEAHPRSVLTEEDVLLIRELHAQGRDCAQLGRDFAISRNNAWLIVTRKTWRHI